VRNGEDAPVIDQRGQLLRAALGFAGLPRLSYDHSLWAPHTWLDSWAGIGRIAVGMVRQGYDLQLTRWCHATQKEANQE